MKICPKCKTEYGDEMNFCLTDGSTLKDAALFNPEETIAITDNATLEYKSPQTGNQNQITNRTDFGKPPRSSLRWVILLGVLGLILLFFGAIGGAIIYFRNFVINPPDFTSTPTRTPYQVVSPINTSTPQPKENLKVEILDKVKNNSGQNFLKCKVTNVGNSIARPFSISLAFYKNDVMIKETGAFVKLKYLKPQQSVPVWVNLYGVDGYTSVKVKNSGSNFPVNKSAEQMFINLNFTETAIKPGFARGYLKFEGIVENQNYDSISTELYVIFYDENKEIIGIETKNTSKMPKNEKTKFEMTISDRDLFGKPKTFEIIPISD